LTWVFVQGFPEFLVTPLSRGALAIQTNAAVDVGSTSD